MLLYSAKNYKIDVVDILISKIGAPDSSDNILVGGVFPEDEQVLLGLPFRSSSNSNFLSDEWISYISGVGQKFYGGASEFREKVRKYAIQMGFTFYYYRNNSRYKSLCYEDPDCTFSINGGLSLKESCFSIFDCNLEHICSLRRHKNHPFINSDLVSSCLYTDVLFNVSIPPKYIIKIFKLYYGFEISYKIALTARSKAIENIFGKEADSFNKLLWYKDVVLESNPGSIFYLEIDATSNRFQRLFVAYGGCINGFEHCIPVIIVDGCFGRSSYKGQVISATALNGNKGNSFYPLAMCICDSETEDNWLFFFKNMKKILDRSARVVIFISDRGVGLLLAFDKILEGIPHLYCYKHLKDNLWCRFTGRGGTLKGNLFVSAFLKCAYSSSEKEYYFNLNLLRIEGGPKLIDNFLQDLPLENWCRAFGVGTRYGVMANSVAESFNRWINVQRGLPVYSLLQEVRIKEMEMISNRRVDSSKWLTTFCRILKVGHVMMLSLYISDVT